MTYFDSSGFHAVKKVDVVILGSPGKEDLSQLLHELSLTHTVLGTGYDDLNKRAVTNALMQRWKDFQPKFERYAQTFLKKADPRLLISFVDNDHRFWKLSQDSGLPLIVIQNGVRGGSHDIDLSTQFPGQIDRLFCFNPSMARAFQSRVQVNQWHVIGSLKNNNRPINGERREGVGWISQFWHSRKRDNLAARRHNQVQARACKLLYGWAKSAGESFSVIGRHQDDIGGHEQNFFAAALEDHAQFTPGTSAGSYDAIDKLRLVASAGSTLGHEALVRGGAVFFFNVGSSELDDETLNLGWPTQFAPDGEFWHSNLEEEAAIYSKLNSLYELSDSRFQKLYDEEINSLMLRDPGNKQLKQALVSYFDQRI